MKKVFISDDVLSSIDLKAEYYYNKIIETANKSIPFPEKISFILVDHCLITLRSHVQSLEKLGRVAAVILKSSTHYQSSEEYAYENCNVINTNKDALKNPKVAIDMINNAILDSEKFMILDHGGYFSASFDEIILNKKISNKLLGIVEVTENGHNKYVKAFFKTDKVVPLISLARTNIKELEDIQVGASICDVADSILRKDVHAALRNMRTACVIGYGKIGRSIANSCKSFGVPEIIILERNSMRALLAINEGHKVVCVNSNKNGRINALRKSEIIFSATGNKALTKNDVQYLCSSDRCTMNSATTYIVSCTSPDDEFGPNFFSELSKQSVNRKNYFKLQNSNTSLYKLFDRRSVYVLNQGKAVNFALGGSPGYGICQVWAAILYSAIKLGTNSVRPENFIQELPMPDQQEVCNITFNTFFSDLTLSNEKFMARSRSPSMEEIQNKNKMAAPMRICSNANHPSLFKIPVKLEVDPIKEAQSTIKKIINSDSLIESCVVL